MHHEIVDRADWLEVRQKLLTKEKEFTRQRDALSAARREMPWVKIDQDYAFDSEAGRKTLSDLFKGKSQLLIYHFMFGKDWKEGCPNCSMWADSFDGIDVHLADRDVSFFAVSRGPLAKLLGFKKRMGWSFDWASSAPSKFSEDLGVSFDKQQISAGEANYNYRPFEIDADERHGISAFTHGEDGAIYHTYSTYARGADLMNSVYNYLDLVPAGRGEDELDFPMSWFRHHDKY